MSELSQVLEALTEFRVENAEAHGRIDEHLRQGDSARVELEEKVDELVIEAAVAKSTGARAGRKWGLGVGAIAVAIAEAIRSMFGY